MITIAYLTDTHLDETSPGQHGADEHHNWQLALADLSTRNIDQIVFGGDIGAFSAYPDFFEAVSVYPNLRVTPGNHDTSAQVRHFFPQQKHTESGFYDAEDDNHFKWIFLDSSTDKISPEQMDWLQHQITDCEKDILLFIHHPVLKVDTAVDSKYPLENRDEIKQLLMRHPKKVIVFCGHYHIEDETSEANIKQYVTPAISYQIKKSTTAIEGDSTYFGYRIIEIDADKIDTEVIILYPDEF